MRVRDLFVLIVKILRLIYSDKPSGGGVLLPQGFRKITKIDIETIESKQ